MQDKELEQLKKIKTPRASQKAKTLALSAALEAFEEEKISAKKENEEIYQGYADSPRHIDNTKQNLWSYIMKKRYLVGTALAGVAAVMVGLPMLKDSVPFNSERLKQKQLEEIQKSQPVENAQRPTQDSEQKIEIAINDTIAPELPEFDKEISTVTKFDDAPSMVNEKIAMAEQESFAGDVAVDAIAPQPQGYGAVAKSKKAERHQSAPASITVGAMSAFVPPQAITAPGVPHDGYIVPEQQNRDKFSQEETNPVKKVSEEPVSTISVDVDTASYSYVRRTLNNGRSVNKGSVRVEELINYFDYKYPYPEDSSTPFKPSMTVYPTPWNEHTKLLHIGIKGYDIVPDEKPRSNLVFLLDVSGSMNSPDKLPLLKNSLRMLVNNMDENDTVSIVTYAGYAGTALEPTPGSQKEKILSALNNLRSGGSTAGAQGIKQAYALAEQNFDKEGVNRIILATDGDFNVGIRSNDDLKKLIEEKRESGIFLSILGFGQGNYNDSLMQTLAQNGNGNAAYIDNLNEARKVLVDEASSTLFPIAKDVKIQIEFNPSLISEYRLIGYETRKLRRQDFNNDKIDAGDIGSGHTVTAIYEITPVGSKAQMYDDLRYQKPTKAEASLDNEITEENNNEYAFLKMRYKLPTEDTSKLIQFPITKELEFDSISQTSTEVRFATSVAAFGQKIRKENFVSSYSYKDIINLANESTGKDTFGYRSEFINLVRLAESLNN